MTTREMIMELLATISTDISINIDDSHIYVTVNTFGGISDNGEILNRELENKDLVCSVKRQIEKLAFFSNKDYLLGYETFQFDHFSIVWHSASLDF